MPKVSVIIPVYGVERFIERCVDSLFNQTLDNIEFIFIDDCTPDNSISLLHAQIKKYQQRIDAQNWSIKLERMSVNSGQAAVRKYGISIASGQYIIHCDSDDWVDLNMYETLYNKAIQTNADIVICDFYRSGDYEERYIKSFFSSHKDHIIRDFLCGKAYWSLCNKLIKRELYTNIEYYPTNNMGEDMVLMLQIAKFSKKVTYIENALYHYYKNENSIVGDTSSESIYKKFCQLVLNVKMAEDFLNPHIQGLRDKLAIDAWKCRQLEIMYPILSNSYYFAVWKQTFPKIKYRIWYNPYIGLKAKAKYYLFLFRLK